MSDVKKTININPDLLNISGRKSRKASTKKERKIKPKAFIKPNTLKKALLKRIKEHQKKEENKQTTIKDNDEEIEKFSSEFNKSLDYLQELTKKRKHDQYQKKQKTLKRNVLPSSPVDIELPNELRDPNIAQTSTNELPYGCLKNGNKPTFREWKNKTLKKTDSGPHINISMPEVPETPRQHKLKEIQEKVRENSDNQNKKFRQKHKKTTTTKYTLGKKKNGTVSVLIKNRQTRKRIQKEHGLLKQRTINEVKTYLYKKNLLRAGTNAPNDVLRTMYEQSILTGDITNVAKDITIHNYTHEV